jgi:glycosyltransferase involved in cell wall biosynthesis
VIVPPMEIPLRPLATPAEAPPPSGVWRIEEPTPWRLGIVGQSHHAVQDVEVGEGLKRLRHYTDELAVYDPGRLRFEFGDQRNVRFFVRAPNGLVPFLSRLDAFVVRPRTWYHESGMQEFFAARMLGLPVLCPAASRWAEYMEDGIDGLLYESDDRLLELVSDLRTAPGWAADLGAAALTRTVALLDPEKLGRAYAQLIHGPRNVGSGQAGRLNLS